MSVYSEASLRLIKAHNSREQLLDQPLANEAEFNAVQHQIEADEQCIDIETSILMTGRFNVWGERY